MKPRTAIGLGSVALGMMVAGIGIAENGSAATSGGGGTPGAGAIIAGSLMIGVPLLCLAVSIIRSIVRWAVQSARQYASWRKTLTPEELQALRAAEAVSLFALGEELHRQWLRRNREKSAEITGKIVHGGDPWQ